MKVAPFLGLIVVLGVIGLSQGRPTDSKPETGVRANGLFVLGSLNNAAVSNQGGTAQASSDRNESEWNHVQMVNANKTNPKPVENKPPEHPYNYDAMYERQRQ